MRQAIVVISLVAVACKSAPPDSGGAVGAGTTTISSGAHTQRSETTSVSPEAELRLDRTTFAAGSQVLMRITSRTNDTLGFNQCSSRTIERQQGQAWVAHPEPDRMCTMELRLLMPRESQTATTDLPGNLTVGTYRIVLSFGRQRTPPPNAPADWGVVRAVSAPFRIE
jgi:Big-like domain-containing protein